jgi:putative membrane protein
MDDPRTLQANERTLLAWLRTGLSLITFGFVIAKTTIWLRATAVTGAQGLSTHVGTLFILLGVAAELIGLVRYLRVRRALLARTSVPTGAVEIIVITAVIAFLGLALGVHQLVPAFGAHGAR